MLARASLLPNTRFNKHKHVRTSFMSKKNVLIFFPRLHLYLCPQFLEQHVAKILSVKSTL